VLVDRLGSEHSPAVIARCIALLVVLFATMMAPAGTPAWNAAGPQLSAGQLDQPRAAVMGQSDVELQAPDHVDRARERIAPRWNFTRVAAPPAFRMGSDTPHIVSAAAVRDQRRSIRRLRMHAHLPRMESDPSPA
jgi:hypothetical protein